METFGSPQTHKHCVLTRAPQKIQGFGARKKEAVVWTQGEGVKSFIAGATRISSHDCMKMPSESDWSRRDLGWT